MRSSSCNQRHPTSQDTSRVVSVLRTSNSGIVAVVVATRLILAYNSRCVNNSGGRPAFFFPSFPFSSFPSSTAAVTPAIARQYRVYHHSLQPPWAFMVIIVCAFGGNAVHFFYCAGPERRVDQTPSAAFKDLAFSHGLFFPPFT